MAKYLLIAAILISFATAGIGFLNHGKLEQTKADLEQATTTLGARTTELNKSKEQVKTLDETLKAAEQDKAKLAADLTAAKSSLDTANTKITELDKTVADQTAKITELEAKLLANPTSNPADPTAPVVDVPALTQQINEKDAQIASLNERLQASSAELNTLKTEKKQREEGLTRKGLEGRVLAVNPAWNFVVLGIGDRQGVVSNSEMLLKRGDQYLGKVRITSVEPSTSIADILVNTLPAGVSVQPGDSVIYVGKD
jgi:hypothetical protein